MKDLLIGITTDFAPAEPGRDDRFFIKSTYVRYIREGGARVVLLPDTSPFDPLDWTFLDGVVLSGSGPDIPPAFYGEPVRFLPGSWMREERVTFELGLLDLCERTGLPVFGICGGFQTMNVYRGGSLIQDLPTLAKGPVVHQGADHPVRLSLPWPEEGGEEKSQVLVNSFHHQGVDRLGKNLDILALSPDDRLVEGVFDRSHPFFVGVQWHPERMDPTNALSRTLRSAFLNACKEARAARP